MFGKKKKLDERLFEDVLDIFEKANRRFNEYCRYDYPRFTNRQHDMFQCIEISNSARALFDRITHSQNYKKIEILKVRTKEVLSEVSYSMDDLAKEIWNLKEEEPECSGISSPE